MPTKAEIDAAAKDMGITGTLTPTIRVAIADLILAVRLIALEAATPAPTAAA